MGLSTLMVSGTALPFSMRGGSSSFTLPGVTRADPMTVRTASCISAGVAEAGFTTLTAANPRPAAAPPATFRNSRRDVPRSISVPQGHQERHHILDLLGRQNGLAAPRRRDTHEPLRPMIRRHDRGGVDAARIDDAKPQLSFGQSRAHALEVGREIALKPLVRKRPAVAE